MPDPRAPIGISTDLCARGCTVSRGLGQLQRWALKYLDTQREDGIPFSVPVLKLLEQLGPRVGRDDRGLRRLRQEGQHGGSNQVQSQEGIVKSATIEGVEGAAVSVEQRLAALEQRVEVLEEGQGSEALTFDVSPEIQAVIDAAVALIKGRTTAHASELMNDLAHAVQRATQEGQL